MRSVRNCVGRALFEQFWATRNSTVYRAGTGLINWEATASLGGASTTTAVNTGVKTLHFLPWSICNAKSWLNRNQRFWTEINEEKINKNEDFLYRAASRTCSGNLRNDERKSSNSGRMEELDSRRTKLSRWEILFFMMDIIIIFCWEGTQPSIAQLAERETVEG